MTSSLAAKFASPQGNQRPRISWVPPYGSSSGPEAIQLARLAGIELDPWQQAELTDGLGESADWKCPHCVYRQPSRAPCPDHPAATLIRPWAAFEVTHVVPRQNGKSELLIARMLAGLFILEEPLQIYSAHEFSTAMEVFLRLITVVEQTPELVALVKLNRGKVGTYSHGQEGITLKTGERIRFKARTGGGGRGFSCDCLYLDEAMILPERFLGATVPTLSARANPQIWLAGSAPDEDEPTHDGVVLAKRRKRALAGGDLSLAYFEHSAEGDHPDTVADEVLDDPRQWARANPGLGIRITTEYIANERRAMGRRQFAVERLGIGAWPDLSEDPDRVISVEQWKACECNDPSKRIVGPKTFAIDVAPGEAFGSIAVAGARDDGFDHIAIVEHKPGTSWMVPALRGLLAERRARLVGDRGGPAAAVIQALIDAGLLTEKDLTTSSEYAQACAEFFNAVDNAAVRYPVPQPDLDVALAAARTTPLEGAWKWSRTTSTSPDISPLIAVTLARWGHRHRKSRSRVINPNDYQ
jgi:hypothetical protein